ncbi:hypothetical protein D6789_04905 [Candidatus Woesearchaeota archaeon]|nr:MAG: hypothetical protein D6789_04905 [Candidatus Woesearchaeota archaeon]
MTKRKKRPSSKRSTTSATEPETVIIVDELAEVEAEDPTFAGMRSMNALEDAYERVKVSLREAHQSRFRHKAPDAPRDVFRELVNEVTLPHQAAIERLLLINEGEAAATAEERAAILAIIDDFCERVISAVR